MSDRRPPPSLNAVISHRIEVAPGLIILRVVPDEWEIPTFRPGQFAVLGLPVDAARCADADAEKNLPAKPGKLIRRAYSIASSSVEREYLEFYVTLVSSGALTPRLFALHAGDRVWLGPRITGTFTLDEAPPEADLVLVATGTGLAPYMSMLRTALPACNGRRWAVLLGARHSWDLGYHAELMTMQSLCPRFCYLPTISRPGEEVVPWNGHVGYVIDLWRNRILEKMWEKRPNVATTRIFLCGNPAMIDDMCRELGHEGFSEHSRTNPGEIFVERYW